VSLYVDLGNSTDPSSADATNLFVTDIEGFGNGPPDPDDQVTTTTAAPTATTAAPVPSATAKFASGTCCFHVDEWQDCNNDSKNLYANITMYDNAKNMIYETPQNYFANGGLGEPINSGNGATFQGPLPKAIAIVGEHEHDYVQFAYGSVSWTSRTTSGPATCKNGGWNPRDGPICLGGSLTDPAENQMDCCFPC
jgi:hypothetical protein